MIQANMIRSVDLAWNAPADCPPYSQAVSDVDSMLHASREPPVHAAVRIDVARGEDGRWRAVLAVEARGVRGVREIDAESCEAIASAAELIIAVAAEAPGSRFPTTNWKAS